MENSIDKEQEEIHNSVKLINKILKDATPDVKQKIYSLALTYLKHRNGLKTESDKLNNIYNRIRKLNEKIDTVL
jgi:hypothetical protein